MIAVLQRVRSARVVVDGNRVGQVGRGLLILVGAARGDDQEDCRLLARKCAGLRVFEDEAGRMNRSVVDLGLGALVVSQFTLLADVKKGRRPGFDQAEQPETARQLLADFILELERQGLTVEQGEFGADMDVELVNQGPATFILDSRTWRRDS